MEYSLNLLSKYRTQLMGFAMLWIIFFHSALHFSNDFLRIFRGIGYMGVDIFLFLSGIGITYSLQQNSNILSFYKKRLLRILPSYITIMLIMGIISYFTGKANIEEIIINFTMLGFWLQKSAHPVIATPWYIPVILFLYLISPAFFYFFNRNKGLTLGLFIIIPLLLVYLVFDTPFEGLGTFFFMRIPIYFIGICTGYLILRNTTLNIYQIILLCISLPIGIFLYILKIDYGYLPHNTFLKVLFLWLPCLFVSTSMSVILSQIFQISKYKFPILLFFGKYSLIIYLVHDKLLFILRGLNIQFSNILSVILTCIIAYYLQNILDNKFLKKI